MNVTKGFALMAAMSLFVMATAVADTGSPNPALYEPGDMFFGFNTGRKPLVRQLTGKEYEAIKKENIVFNDQFLTEVAATEFSVRNKDFAEFIARNTKWQQVLAEDGVTEKDVTNWKESRKNELWRRKSKAGVAFLIEKEKKRIHFAIDYPLQQHMADVPTKQASVAFNNLGAEDSSRQQWKTDGEKQRIITHAELRFTYRNWNKPGYRDHVIFWYEVPAELAIQKWEGDLNQLANKGSLNTTFVPGPAPWEAGWAEAWKMYKPLSEET